MYLFTCWVQGYKLNYDPRERTGKSKKLSFQSGTDGLVTFMTGMRKMGDPANTRATLTAGVV